MKAHLNALTNGKYTELNIEDSLPSSIKQSNNKETPVNLLSQGTSGLLGIALRLSMADYFLGNKNGFLIFDDPMTDLDQKRQEAASACLSHYAETKQVILFTCHQSHADRFDGNRIELN
jgi:exonuclease SbcC